MIDAKIPFKKRAYVVYIALRYLPTWSWWGITVLTNYLFRGIIVEVEDYIGE
jgi:hypothetical protein